MQGLILTRPGISWCPSWLILYFWGGLEISGAYACPTLAALFCTWFVFVEHEQELTEQGKVNCLEHLPDETQRTKVNYEPGNVFPVSLQIEAPTMIFSQLSFPQQSSSWLRQTHCW